jgi:hypothetical protein
MIPLGVSFVLVPSHPVAWTEEALLKECTVKRGRHSGPGGQHRNKVETAIEITHQPSGVSTMATERRSQKENLREAIKRLRLRLAIEVRTVQSAEVHPSQLWESRCVGGRLQCSERHIDFAVMLAEALNAIDAKDYDLKCAAAALGCSTSQLIRFVARVPDGLQRVNAERAARGLRTLKP